MFSNASSFTHGLVGSAIVIGAVALLISCSTNQALREVTPAAEHMEPIDFEEAIKPIFEGRCVQCHNGHTAAGDLDLRTRELAFRRSPNGPFFVPGYPERSKLFTVVRLPDTIEGAMPPTGHALTEKELVTIRAWIKQGAEWPEGARGQLKAAPGMGWRSQ